MRKIWPPTYDRFSVRLWAALFSAAINVLLWGFLVSGSEGVFWWMLPGFMPAFVLSAMSGYPEGEGAPMVGTAIFIVCNLGFYYLVSWVLINMFTTSTNWWPEKRS